MRIAHDGLGHLSYVSPLVPVIKPDGKVRLCVDYRRLNSITPQRHHVIPTVSDILERAGKARVMSKLDQAKGLPTSHGRGV